MPMIIDKNTVILYNQITSNDGGIIVETEKKKGIITEFKEFISKGNVVDLAVAVIIGGAFKTIIDSVVADVAMPLLSLIIGKQDFSKWTLSLGSGDHAAVISYGLLISAIINFFFMALVIFLLIKFMTRFSKKKEEGPATTKTCTYCCSEIPIGASRCPLCTSELESEEQT
jgi:large conductance mechanosensitive channel